ncbi:hypothetical protein MRX96_002530 [Rhipicephalus microplus]
MKRRSLPHAEPRKPGQSLRAQNTKAAPCAHLAVKKKAGLCFHKGCRSAHHCQARYFSDQGVPCGVREKTKPASRGTSKAGPATSRPKHEGRVVPTPSSEKESRSFLSVSTKAATQPITAKQDIPAIKVSHVENVKRRSLPHPDPRKPGQPLRARNTKAAPCAHPAVRKKAGPQPITAKQDIPAIKVSHVENVKRRSLPHTKPGKPGQPLRAQNTKAAPCAPPPPSAIKVSHVENAKDEACLTQEPRKPGQPLREQNTKAAPCAHPAVSKKAGLSVSTKAAAQPITVKQDIPAIKVSHVEDVKKTKPASSGSSKAGPATSRRKHEGRAVRPPSGEKKSRSLFPQRVPLSPSLPSKIFPAIKVSHAEYVKRRSLPHAEPQKPSSHFAHKTRRPCRAPTQRGKRKQVFLFPQRPPLSSSLPSKIFQRSRCPMWRTLKDEACLTRNLESRASHFAHKTRRPRRAPPPPAVRKKAGLCFHKNCHSAHHCQARYSSDQGVPCGYREKTKPASRGTSKAGPATSRTKHEGRAVRPPSGEKESRSFCFHKGCRSAHHCQARYSSDQGVPCGEREKTKPASSGSSKAGPATSRTKHEGRAMRPPSGEKESRSFCFHKGCRSAHHSQARYSSDQGVPCGEREKTKPASPGSSKAGPATSRTKHEGRVVRPPSGEKERKVFVFTKAAVQPITGKPIFQRSIKVSHVENVKRRSLPDAEPQKPGQPLRAQNTKAAPCAHPAAAAQPITAKQDIPAIKVSHVKNVKRRSLPHPDPRKPGQPLRAQNTKAAPCAHPAVRKKAGLSVSTKAAAQPITVKQDISAIKVSHVEDMKRRGLSHAEPRKPGQPLRAQNTTAAPCAHPAVRKKAGLSVSTKGAVQPITAKQDIPGIKVSHVENVKRRSLPHAEPRKPGQPLRAQNTKAAPWAHPAVRKKAGLSVSTKAATHPITAKQDITAIKVSHVENVKRRSLPDAEPRKPGQPLRAQNTKAAPCAHPAVKKESRSLFPQRLPLSPSLPSKIFQRSRCPMRST